MRVPVVVGLVCLALAQVKLAELASTADRNEATNGQSQLLRKMRLSRQRLPPPPVRADLRALRAVETRWLENQQLDHFDPTNNQTWRQRYFSNSELYKEGGPIFIFIEGESAANSIWITEDGSYMYSLANIFKAKMYILEHRYFGRSEPTLDISTDNLRWLTADQALADLAYFIEYLIANGEMNRGQKLAVFGGSYAGNLAAWARLKYPHLIHAAVSSSAPVKAQLDFPEYFEVVTKAMRTLSGEECATNLERAFKRIQTLLKTTDGVTKIQDLFYMCKAPDMNNKLDMDLFYETLSGPFATATQYNREYSYDAYSIKAQCNYMLGDNLSDDDLVSKLAKVFYDSMGFIWNCLDFDFASNMEDLKSSDYIDGDRQWFYMTCTSFGYYQTPNGDTVFPKGYFDVDYFLQICKEAFGPEFDNAMAGRGIRRSNIGFGATSPGVENVIFVNGGVDPWHTLGVLEDVNERSPAVFIPGTSHCYDMYPNSFTDSDELVQAREKIKTFLQGALYEAPNGKSPTLSPFN